MNKRMRSPNYPSMPLDRAIDIIGRMFNDLRTSAVDREVAARSMGYTGVTGHSGKILSNLIQYGLLQKVGKNEVRVSSRAVEILHPDDAASKAKALMDAAFEPELFQELRDRFDEGVLSEAAIRSYLIKKGFTDAALQSAIRAYVDTYRYVEQCLEYESYGPSTERAGESVADQKVGTGGAMRAPRTPASKPPAARTESIYPPRATEPSTPQFWVVAPDDIVLGGRARTKEDAQYIIDFFELLKGRLPSQQETKEPGNEGGNDSSLLGEASSFKDE